MPEQILVAVHRPEFRQAVPGPACQPAGVFDAALRGVPAPRRSRLGE